MSLVGTIAANLIGRVNIQQEVEDLAAPAAAKLIAPHVKLTPDELKKCAARCRDMAACFEHNPPKIEAALTELLQVMEDALD